MEIFFLYALTSSNNFFFKIILLLDDLLEIQKNNFNIKFIPIAKILWLQNLKCRKTFKLGFSYNKQSFIIYDESEAR